MFESLKARLGGAGIGGLIARGSSATMVIKVVGIGLTLALHLSLTRLFPTVAEYGVYVYATTLVRTTVLLTTLGFARSSLRFVPEYATQEAWGTLAGYLRRVPRLVTLSSVALALLVGVGVWLRDTSTTQAFLVLTVLTVALLPVRALLEVATACLRGFHKIFVPFASEALLHPIVLLATFGGFYLLEVPFNSVNVMAANLAVTAGVVVMLYYFLAAATPKEVRQARPDTSQTKHWILVSLPFLLLTGFNNLAKQIDLIMVGALLGPGAAGVYAVASRITLFLALPLNSVTSILAPVVSQLYAEGKTEKLQSAVTTATRITFLLTLLGSAVVLVLGEWMLGLFGQAYVEGLVCLYFLIAGQLANAAAGSVGLLMAMTGNQLEASLVVGGSVLVNVSLNLLLVPRYGIEGAAIATAIALSAWNLVLVLRVRKILGIRAQVH